MSGVCTRWGNRSGPKYTLVAAPEYTPDPDLTRPPGVQSSLHGLPLTISGPGLYSHPAGQTQKRRRHSHSTQPSSSTQGRDSGSAQQTEQAKLLSLGEYLKFGFSLKYWLHLCVCSDLSEIALLHEENRESSKTVLESLDFSVKKYCGEKCQHFHAFLVTPSCLNYNVNWESQC